MSQSKKKIVIAGGTVAVVALVCIFGGQYLANKIADDRVDQPEPVAMQPIKTADQAKVEPIVEATVYDETGDVAIKPNPEDKAEAEANVAASTQENATKSLDTPAPAAPTAPAPKAETKPTPAPVPKSEPTPAPAPAPEPEPEPEPTPESAPETSTPKDSGGHEGQVYDPVFGWTDVSNAESIPMEDQGGDYDKMVGTMD